MHISFPVHMPWRRKSPGSREPLTRIIDGRACLVVFENIADAMRYYMEWDDATHGQLEEAEQLTLPMLRAFVNGVSYQHVVINPGLDSQRINSHEELRQFAEGNNG